MSSDRKDARWELAFRVSSALGLDSINELPYHQAQALLLALDSTLDHVSEEKVRELARYEVEDDADYRHARWVAGQDQPTDFARAIFDKEAYVAGFKAARDS